MHNDKKIFLLEGVVQHYKWGGKNFIPALIKHENANEKPYAEYWLGAHRNAPSLILSDNEEKISLAEYIDSDPERRLGKKVYEQFKHLPYLFKVQDVKDMLSIQAHPHKHVAEKKYAEETEKGIPVNAPNRNYKDQNHKPELAFAVSDFWLLHGFKSPEKLKDVLNRTPELTFLLPIFEESAYEGVYKHVMEMPQEKVNEYLQPLIQRILPLYKKNELVKSSEDFWAARAAIDFSNNSNYDRGIFSIYLFNIVNLKPGQSIFQDANIPHAYLEGYNMEIMANSDNVLRGGLTDKYIDVPELLKNIKFEPTIPNVFTGEKNAAGELVLKTPVKDFELSCIKSEAPKEISLTSRTVEIYFTLEGKAILSVENDSITVGKGKAAVVMADCNVNIALDETSTLFRATVPE
jgi:mannose-6-phosphate isomerase